MHILEWNDGLSAPLKIATICMARKGEICMNTNLNN